VTEFLNFTILGLVTAAIYAVAASGLVVTYTTSGIFNFAQGAMGMISAFIYWQFAVEWGWPAPLALLVVLGIIAPLFGATVERVIMRGLTDVSEVTKIVVSVALLFGVFNLAPILFPAQGRRLEGFFAPNSFRIADVNVTYHNATTVVVAIVVAIALRAFLFRTRTGIAMRGVVDDRDLAELNGARPARASMLAWAMGATLAALSGILLAGSQGALTVIPLTLLVVNAYAAAMFGRLKSLPLTFVGALILGLAEAYAVGYLPTDTTITSVLGWQPSVPISLSGLRPAIPVIFLFLVLLFTPQVRARVGVQRRSREYLPMPNPMRWVIGTGVLIVLALIVGAIYSDTRVLQLGEGMALAIIMLSLVPLTGYGGQINLAPLSFAGIGAVMMGQFGGDGSLWGLFLAVVVTGLVGAVVALPALRLSGLYLALLTAAFAVFMDRIVFTQGLVMPNGALSVPRLDIGPVSFDSNQANLVLICGVFGIVATLIVILRRGEFGRRLQAMKTSPAACTTLGLSLTTTKLEAFALSAAIAGLGGALYGGLVVSVSPDRFQFFQSLPVVLLAVVGGIGAVGGALFGGIAFALSFFIIPEIIPSLEDILLLTPALAGISLGRNPNGAVNETAKAIRESRQAAKATVEDPLADVGDLFGVGEPMPATDLVLIDNALGLDEERILDRGRPVELDTIPEEVG
jgi:branched-chain amino acid transport system permease protein